jgi:hypothetical protein
MYHGRLPKPPAGSTPAPAAPTRRSLSRRRLLWVGAAFAVGSLSGGLAVRATQRRAAPAEPEPPAEPDPPADRGSLAWALALAAASDDELLAVAGDLERVSARHRGEDGLVPLFARLLDLALDREPQTADPAAACALRSLLRHGRRDLALEQRRRIEARPELVEAGRALARALPPAEQR